MPHLAEGRADSPVVFEHRHPVEGFLRVRKEGSVVQVDCRWPFDRETGDWIFIANRLPLSDYAACLEEFAATGHGRAPGIDNGFLEFAAVGSDETQVEICDAAPHAPTRLSLKIPESSESLGGRLRDALRRS